MIPRRAFFTWGGGDMPWIREQCVASFVSLNPDWRVDVLEVKGANRGEIIKNSDVLRYKELSERGGVYFDTDIVFTRPLDEFMARVGTCDTVVCYDTITGVNLIKPDGSIERNSTKSAFYSVASLMSEPGNRFFSEAMAHAVREDVIGEEDCQACGVWTLGERFKSLSSAVTEFPEHSFYNVPRKAFLPVDYDSPKTLFRKDDDLWTRLKTDPDVFGVHWYGGSEVGRLADSWNEETFWGDTVIGKLVSCARSSNCPDELSVIWNWPELNGWIREHTKNSACLVDFGAGRFNYTDVAQSIRKIGVESFQKYIDLYGDSYPHVEKVCGDMMQWKELGLPEFDCAMFIDSIEHITMERAKHLIASLQESGHCKKIMVFCPEGVYEQDTDNWGHGNHEGQSHKSTWYVEDFESMGFKCDRVGTDQLWAVWG